MKPRKSSSSIGASAEIIGGNDDLLMEILLLLPAKSLGRFKLVSKHWHSLISAPSFFLHHHRRRAESQHSFILSSSTSQFFICNPTIKKLVPFNLPFRYVKILQSCNGLLLLECWNSKRGAREYHVFNPTTTKSRNLFLKRPFFAVYLMFDPRKSGHYTVVCFKNDKDGSTSFRVYNSETCRWNDRVKSQMGQYKSRDGVCWKGGLYFSRCEESKSFKFFLNGEICVLPDRPRFDLRRGKMNYSYIMESSGCMHYAMLTLQPNCLFVYEMNDDESGWLMNLYVDLNPIWAEFAANGGRNIDLLGMIRGGKEGDSVVLFLVPGKIMMYSVCDEVFEVLVDFRNESYFEEDRLLYGFKDAHLY